MPVNNPHYSISARIASSEATQPGLILHHHQPDVQSERDRLYFAFSGSDFVSECICCHDGWMTHHCLACFRSNHDTTQAILTVDSVDPTPIAPVTIINSDDIDYKIVEKLNEIIEYINTDIKNLTATQYEIADVLACDLEKALAFLDAVLFKLSPTSENYRLFNPITEFMTNNGFSVTYPFYMEHVNATT